MNLERDGSNGQNRDIYNGRLYRCGWIIHHQPATDVHGNDLLTTMTLPREGATCLRVAKQEAFVMGKVMRRPGFAVALQIRWRSAGQHPCIEELASNQRFDIGWAEPYRHVDTG